MTRSLSSILFIFALAFVACVAAQDNASDASLLAELEADLEDTAIESNAEVTYLEEFAGEVGGIAPTDAATEEVSLSEDDDSEESPALSVDDIAEALQNGDYASILSKRITCPCASNANLHLVDRILREAHERSNAHSIIRTLHEVRGRIVGARQSCREQSRLHHREIKAHERKSRRHRALRQRISARKQAAAHRAEVAEARRLARINKKGCACPASARRHSRRLVKASKHEVSVEKKRLIAARRELKRAKKALARAEAEARHQEISYASSEFSCKCATHHDAAAAAPCPFNRKKHHARHPRPAVAPHHPVDEKERAAAAAEKEKRRAAAAAEKEKRRAAAAERKKRREAAAAEKEKRRAAAAAEKEKRRAAAAAEKKLRREAEKKRRHEAALKAAAQEEKRRLKRAEKEAVRKELEKREREKRRQRKAVRDERERRQLEEHEKAEKARRDKIKTAKAAAAARAAAKPVAQPVRSVCHSIGDPHLRSFDGLVYDYQVTGEFILARFGEDFEVQSHAEPCVTNPAPRCNQGIAVRGGHHTVVIRAAKTAKGENLVLIDGEEFKPVVGKAEDIAKGFSLNVVNNVYTINYKQAVIRANIFPLGTGKYMDMYVEAPETWKNTEMDGLCGNFNGDTKDDTTNVQQAKKYWVAKTSHSLFESAHPRSRADLELEDETLSSEQESQQEDIDKAYAEAGLVTDQPAANRALAFLSEEQRQLAASVCQDGIHGSDQTACQYDLSAGMPASSVVKSFQNAELLDHEVLLSLCLSIGGSFKTDLLRRENKEGFSIAFWFQQTAASKTVANVITRARDFSIARHENGLVVTHGAARCESKDAAPIGRWTQVVVSVTHQGSIITYINGAKSCEAKVTGATSDDFFKAPLDYHFSAQARAARLFYIPLTVKASEVPRYADRIAPPEGFCPAK